MMAKRRAEMREENRPKDGRPDGEVIRRRRAWDEDDDVWIVLGQTQIRTVIDAMEKVLKEIHPLITRVDSYMFEELKYRWGVT